MTDYATTLRYSEEFYTPSREETEEAIKLTEKVRKFVLGRFKAAGFEPRR